MVRWYQSVQAVYDHGTPPHRLLPVEDNGTESPESDLAICSIITLSLPPKPKVAMACAGRSP